MPLSTLCRACNLCCDGTLFDVVVLRPSEAEACTALGPRLRPDGSLVVDQRCPALGEGGCTAYATRPGQCRAYVCLLYRAVEEGDVALPAALDVVAQALAKRGTPQGPAFLRFNFRGQRG